MKKLLLAFFILCTTSVAQDNHQKPPTLWLTVFLHGGGLHPAYFSISDFFSVIHDRADQTVYARTTHLLRHDPFFFQVQPMGFPGLHRAYPSKEIKTGANIFGMLQQRVHKLITPDIPRTLYYSYGWEGILSRNARRRAARRLYLELVARVEYFKKMGYCPKIRLIGYSHGGNVLLLMGEEARNHPIGTLTIDELVLISTPIQRGTQTYVTSPLFKKIFLLYSIGDRIQSTDFLSAPKNLFTSHTFVNRKGFVVPKKVTQVQVRFIRKSIKVRNKDGSIKIFHHRDVMNPNHTEMFFFGWTPEWYRRYLPIRPLPVGAFTPLITQTIDTLHLDGNHVLVTIIPEEEKMIIKNRADNQSYTTHFITQNQLTTLQKELWRYKPKGFEKSSQFHKYYRARMKRALHQAQREAALEKKSRKAAQKSLPQARRARSAS